MSVATVHDALAAEYSAALAAYVRAPDEGGRARAYDLGRRAVEAEIGLLDLAAIHRLAVCEIVADDLSQPRVLAAVEFFTESLSTFEMAQRGYREVQERAALEHDIALTLQRSLLPAELPAPAGVEVAVRYLPAGPYIEVGGDWYDVIDLSHGSVGLVVGDVMGHGIRQAAVMGQMRLGLRAYLLEEHPIDEVVRRTDALLQHLGEMHTATLVLGVVDLTTPALSLVNAGHPPPVLVDPDGDAAYVTGGHGRLLGLAEPADRPVHGPAEIAPGTCVLMYTDGLLESHERAGDDGYALLHKTVQGFVGTPDELCDRVTDAMVDDAPSDDICLLAAKVVARPGEG
jgi:serine phosphatase RsbU (regulator of sigma subunit)